MELILEKFQNDIVSDTRLLKTNDILVVYPTCERFINNNIIKEAFYLIVANGFYLRNLSFKKNNKIIEVEDVRNYSLKILKERYKMPKKLFAITGTKGKTSSGYYSFQLLSSLGKRAGYFGTIGGFVLLENNLIKLPINLTFDTHTMTTPSLEDMFKLCDYFVKEYNIEILIFELSSHALDQKRITGIDIDYVSFINFGQDHLDYHKTIEGYFLAKKRIFSDYNSKIAILNKDIEGYEDLEKEAKKNQIRVISYGFKDGSDFEIKRIENREKDSNIVSFTFRDQSYDFNTLINSEFQISNLFNGIILGFLEGFEIREILNHILKVKNVKGRFDNIISNGTKTNIFIDIAHTPESIYLLLKNIKTLFPNKKIISIFGCGGNRDRIKRPIITNIMIKMSDICKFTKDNPRDEELDDIFLDMRSGIDTDNLSKRFNSKEIQFIQLKISEFNQKIEKNFKIIQSRYDFNYSREDSINSIKDYINNGEFVILIVGKGDQETMIEKNGEVIFFSDYECIFDLLR